MKDNEGGKDPTKRDYGYIEYYHKAMPLYTDPDENSELFHRIKYHEALRDYYTQTVRNIDHLVQIDQKPNRELTEPRCEIYKITLSFWAQKYKCKEIGKTFLHIRSI